MEIDTDSLIKTKPFYEKELSFKTSRVLSKKTVDIIIPFFNESDNVADTHRSTEKLERLFRIKNYIYINNGSKDNTLSELKKLKAENPKIKIIDIEKNTGYGNGFKKGFEKSTANFVITNHADQQFDAFSFYSHLLDELKMLDQGVSVFSIRTGRPYSSILFTRILRAVLSIILRVKLNEFNGQPKLIDASSISVPIHDFPDDFSFDLMLYLALRKKNFYPIHEQNREAGVSSWNDGLRSKFTLFKSYIKSAGKMKKIIKQTPV